MRFLAAMITAAVLSAGASAAHAGVYGDDLSRCLVSSTTAGDKTTLTRWIFLMLSRHPSVRAYANVADDQRAAADKEAAALYLRLLTADCRKETVAALKYEGGSALEASFNILGQAAVRELISDPAVLEGFKTLATNINTDSLASVFKDAGVAVQKVQ